MLKSGDYEVADVAESTGFSDTHYFYKQFKKIMDIAPSKLIPKRRGYSI
jgi:YesN/AraC family two-component response regulator